MEEVTITIERYEELLNCEARVEVTVSLLANDRFMSTEDMLGILGAETEADNLEERENKNIKSFPLRNFLKHRLGGICQ